MLRRIGRYAFMHHMHNAALPQPNCQGTGWHCTFVPYWLSRGSASFCGHADSNYRANRSPRYGMPEPAKRSLRRRISAALVPAYDLLAPHSRPDVDQPAEGDGDGCCQEQDFANRELEYLVSAHLPSDVPAKFTSHVPRYPADEARKTHRHADEEGEQNAIEDVKDEHRSGRREPVAFLRGFDNSPGYDSVRLQLEENICMRAVTDLLFEVECLYVRPTRITPGHRQALSDHPGMNPALAG